MAKLSVDFKSFAKAALSPVRFFAGIPLSDWKWSSWLVVAVQVTVISLIFRAWIGPWMLRAVLRRVRVRSVSPRSVRGIRIRTKRMTIRLDRLGLSYHKPSLETARRISIQIQGLNIELHEIKREEVSPDRSQTRQQQLRRFRRRPTLSDFSPSPLWHNFWALYSYTYEIVEPYVRPLVRTFFVTSTRVIIRCLPTLTHIIDLELERVLISMPGLPESHITIRSATLSTTVSFSGLESVLNVNVQEPQMVRVNRRFLGMGHFRTRFGGSVRRVWDRAWGRTQGAAVFELKVGRIAAYADESKWLYPQAARFQDTESNSQISASRFDFVTSSLHDDVACFNLPDTTTFVSSFKFGPKQGILEKQSVEISLSVSRVHVALDALFKLRQVLKSANGQSVGHVNRRQDSTSISSPISPTSAEPIFLPDVPKDKSRKRLKSNSVVDFMKSCNFSVKNIMIQFRPWYEEVNSGQLYTAYARDLKIMLSISDPSSNELHLKHLGRTPRDELGPVYSMLLSIREITVQRNEDVHDQTFLRVISIGRVGVDCLASQWPNHILSSSRKTQGEPNDSLLVVDLDVSAPQFCERLDVLASMLNFRMPKQSSEPSNPSRVLNFVPRIVFGLSVRDIAACLIPVGKTSSSIIVSSTQATFSFSSFFKSLPLGRPNFPESCSCGYIPTEFMGEGHAVLGPAFMTYLSHRFDLEESDRVSRYVESPSTFGEPLVSLGTLELQINGRVLGGVFGDMGSVSLDLCSAMLDASLISDAVSIELWQPTAVAGLADLLQFFSSLNPKRKSGENDGSQQTMDPGTSISFYFALGHLGVVVTSKDLNPEEDLGISRGIALQTGFSAHFCSFRGRGHHARLRNQQTHARARQRLSLTEDLTTEAIAQANGQSADAGRFTLVRVKTWDTTVRTAVATEYATDHDYHDVKGSDELRTTEFIWIDNLQLDVMTKREKRPDGTERDRTQLQLHVPYLESRLRLVHIYSTLLASVTLQSLSNIQRPRPSSGKYDIEKNVVFKASVDTIQALVYFPLQEQLCIRVNKLSSRVSNKEPIALAWGMLFLWIPSRKLLGTWEEIGRLRSWKVTCSAPDNQPMLIDVEGDGASIRIPYNSIFADLILDISVAFKACKHLHHVVSSKKYHPLAVPGPEDAKLVPDVSLKVSCITVEAADDTLEAKLGLSWRCGLEAAKTRQERDEAFEAKVSAIYSAENTSSTTMGPDTRFSAQHSVSVEEARERLLQVHSISWVSLHQEYKEAQRRKEDKARRRIRGDHSLFSGVDVPPLVNVLLPSRAPPLARITLNDVVLSISRPQFEGRGLADFLFDLGKGLPRNTLFTLLVPMHLKLATSSAQVTLRDYPLPLLNIPREKKIVALVIETDVVIAEEMGTLSSTLWKECLIVPAGFGSPGTPSFSFDVPKTSMPVKSYANPSILVKSRGVTEFCWGVSYGPALQDVMRVMDTLTTPPPDPSPVLGFWDKMRLVLHWKVRVTFDNQVHLNLKGSRDPHSIHGDGAGFAFCWNGNTEMLINYENSGDELLQLTSDTMLIVIPDFSLRSENEDFDDDVQEEDFAHDHRKRYKKICANFTSGIRWGIGFILERSCDEVCPVCNGAFLCRHFTFRPHYDVQLEPKDPAPREKSLDDSFNGFRSDFIHLSTSLTSRTGADSSHKVGPSSFYLTPRTFSHFWSWWDLFDRFLSLPIRQGSQFPNARPPSRKFGQHLATIKYRISVPQLFISHLYVDDTLESWQDGVTNFIGIKALVDLFEADMHQREQEAIVPGTNKKIRHKPFYAAEVKLIGLHLRAVRATFFDPLKQDVAVEMAAGEGDGSFSNDSCINDDPPQNWVDLCDFVELDCAPNDSHPSLSMLPIASCPRFSYFRRASGQAQGGDLRGVASEQSRFGDENTHVCLLGKEPSLHQIQSDLVSARIATLKSDLARVHGIHLPDNATSIDNHDSVDRLSSDIIKKIRQLEQYATQLRDTDDQDRPKFEPSASFSTYLLPSDIDCPADWTEFDNVYQFHQLNIFLANTTRNILMRYYHCSRSRRGFEYHIATRAVRFIRDQANSLIPPVDEVKDKKQRRTTNSAQVAAQALKKMLVGDDEVTFRTSGTDEAKPFDPLEGWSDGVAVRKGHFCLLLKPQIVLSCDASKDAVVVLAALQATMQSFAILDTANADDPVSGRIMTRTHAVLTGLQSFAPSPKCNITSDGVPLEVLVDLRADSEDFDRLVPQTNAVFRYDKFNRLRLRSNLTSIIANPIHKANDHLQHQMDLIDIQVPRFSVTAGSRNFQAISTIITKLLLFSDAMHKQRSSAVETLLFKYDFTNLLSAASVVEGFQARLRRAVEREQLLGNYHSYEDEPTQIDVLRTKAHVLLLSNELGLIFDAIKLAQDKADEKHADQKSALKLHAASTEISWGMVDDLDLLVKLAVRGIDFSWLSRQDGSTVNKLHISDLQAFDGSRDAEWPEIISKYKDPSNHPLVKRGIFAEANWTVLAPVGGIVIFENFLLQLHPMRLQLESRVGKIIMEYVFPGRRERKKAVRQSSDLQDQPETPPASARSNNHLFHNALVTHSDPSMLQRSSAESPRTPSGRYSIEERRPTLSTNSSKRLVAARSFSDLRQATRQTISRQNSMKMPDEVSPYLLVDKPTSSLFDFNGSSTSRTVPQLELTPAQKAQDDAAEMKTRAAQNTFVLVKISSMHLLLSFRKDGSFFCRDARIRTRELVIRNQTWSFEELANQFIPSDPTWRGWMKIALHQPLVPVLPVARELLSKTKWMKGRRKTEKLEENELIIPNSSAASSSVRIQSPPKVNIFRHLKKSSADSKVSIPKDANKTLRPPS